MNREIEFRSYNKNTNQMLYTDWYSFRNWYNESEGGKVVYGRGFDGEKLVLSEPMQFIGLRDKNNVKAYFGDFYKVSFGKIYFIPLDADYKKLFQIEENFKHFHPEIIGNFFENPELVEDKKNE